ncbi:amidohydrolase family protein [Streptomyces sp. NPDC050617]|uniref:amidohydrolase family protein n=1 Tax=Streptomyces sp. NPDC050617 TaxID=3154628 RepID=UPI0034404DE3
MALHLNGTLLPDGTTRDLWLVGDRVTFRPPAERAETVADGGFLLPGLVDLHTHPGLRDDGGFDTDALAAHRDAGVAVLRCPGLDGPVPGALRASPELPRLVTAGAWLAWSGLSDHADFHTVVDDLPGAAVREARSGDGWCKVMADWDFEAAPVPLELLRAATEAVHAAGGRIAAHCQSAQGSLNAARAGVDSIEHGMALPAEALPLMAAHGTAYVPTLTAFGKSAPWRARRGLDRDVLWQQGHRTMITRAREAYEAGVAVLAGTDSLPHGDVVREIEWLIEAGLPAEAAIGAASWRARDWLGLPGLVEGGLADITVYAADPRRDTAVLRAPSRIILRGRVVR